MACALIQKRGDDDSMGDDDEDDGDEDDDGDGNGHSGEDGQGSEGGQEGGDDWQSSRRKQRGSKYPSNGKRSSSNMEQSFKSENISDIDNRRFGKQQSVGEESQFEGGEDEKNDNDFLVDK